MSKTTIGLVQLGVGPDLAANLQKAVDKCTDAAKAGAKIICLPELFRSYYFCQVEDHKYFGTADQPNKPARSTVQVAALVTPGALLEVEVQAVRNK